MIILDHPVKILPYPKSQPIPTMADAIHDVLAIQAEQYVDRVFLDSGYLCHDPISGPQMVDRLWKYLESRSKEDFESVIYPLSMSLTTHGAHDSHSGIGKVDVNALVPPMFRERDRIYLPDPEGWSTALVPFPALATTHYDHAVCGQVMAHFFGRKVTFEISKSLRLFHSSLFRFGCFVLPNPRTCQSGIIPTTLTKPSRR